MPWVNSPIAKWTSTFSWTYNRLVIQRFQLRSGVASDVPTVGGAMCASDSKTRFSSPVLYLGRVILVLAGVGLSALVMELPSLGPRGVNPFCNGAVLSVLWCAGLLSWALRATRSRQSRFGMKTILVVMSVIAIGLANVFAALSILCWTMILDLGVQQSQSNRNLACRTLQGIAGMTGLAHAARMTFQSVMS